MVATAQKRMTIEAYLDFEYDAEIRHEYVNGKLIPMPYTTKSHGRIAQNLSRHIGNCLDGSTFEVYQESRMLHVPNCQSFYYPDLVIVPIEAETFIHKQKMEADLHPVALVEIASESTEENDKDAKWRCYQQIESLQQYVLVSQTEMFVEVYTRQEKKSTLWTYASYSKPEEEVLITQCKIKLSDIYNRVQFPKPDHQSDG